MLLWQFFVLTNGQTLKKLSSHLITLVSMLVDILSSHLLQGKDSLKRQCLLQQLVIAFAGTGDYSVTR